MKILNEQGDQNVQNLDGSAQNEMQIVPPEPNFDEINKNMEMTIKLPKENETRMEKVS